MDLYSTTLHVEIYIQMSSVSMIQQLCIQIVIILDHFCTWLDEVIVPVLKNDENLAKFPQYVADGNTFNANL